MQIQRMFEIVYILLQKRRVTAKELAEHFEVSTRTIYRDLDALSMAGIPLYTNKGHQGGIFLMEDYVLHRSMFSEEEQQKLMAALQSYHCRPAGCGFPAYKIKLHLFRKADQLD